MIGNLARLRRKRARSAPILLKGFPHGLNTATPAFQIAPTEMPFCVNWKINEDGQLETRRPAVRYTDTAVGTIKSMADVPIGSTTYKLLTDADNKIYYLDGTTPVLIGTLEGEAEIIAFNDYAILLDGSYIKYLDDINSIKIAYDDGTGISGYQFNYSTDQNNDSFQLGNGTNTKIAQQFTTQLWDLGYTIPPTTVSAYLTKEGNPTGSINVVIREANLDDLTVLGTVLATKELVSDVSALTGVATEHSIKFTPDDITTEMSSETRYYCSLEFDNADSSVKALTAISKANPGVVDCVDHGYSVGDVDTFSGLTEMTELNDTSQTVTAVADADHFSINDTSGYGAAETTGGDCVQKKASDNYVCVSYNTVISRGKAYHYDGWWKADITENCLMSLRPGKPPKGSHGTIRKERLWVIGDPDNLGYAWYGNLNQFDWSSADGGGYVGIVDSGSNNFPAGGIANFCGDLYVYGRKSQPYLSKLSGNSPSEYVLEKKYQRAWTLSKTLQNAVNDLWVASEDGVDTLSGVQEYGDVRTFSYSDQVRDRLTDYWSSDAIAGYCPQDGQYWLYLPGHHRVLVFRTKKPVLNLGENGVRYPCYEYEFCGKLCTSDDYIWAASDNGINEYYCTQKSEYATDGLGNFLEDENGEYYFGGGSCFISNQPDYITLNNKKITEGTAGGLNDHQWDYGDSDALGYNTLYIRDDSGNPNTTEIEIRNVLVPTCFGILNNEFMFGASDGFLYEIDHTEYKELQAEKIYFDVRSPYLLFPMTYVNLNNYQASLVSRGGASVNISFYKDEFQDIASFSFVKTLVPDDRLRVEDLVMDVGDAVFLVDSTTTRKQNPLWKKININARSIQIEISDVTLAGFPLFLGEQTLRYRGLSY